MATTIDRIKGLKQKTGSNSYTNLIPFGTDGALIDMKSGLNLEEELLIGGQHYTSITENPNTGDISITDIYAEKSEVTAGTAINYYKVETSISTDDITEITTIIQQIWFIVNASTTPELLQTKTVTIEETPSSIEVEEVLT